MLDSLLPVSILGAAAFPCRPLGLCEYCIQGLYGYCQFQLHLLILKYGWGWRLGCSFKK